MNTTAEQWDELIGILRAIAHPDVVNMAYALRSSMEQLEQVVEVTRDAGRYLASSPLSNDKEVARQLDVLLAALDQGEV